MSAAWVVLAYASAVALALLLLYFFRAKPWYWHLISVALAVVLGLTPMPTRWQGPTCDLLLGFLFVFLLLWGVSGPFFRVSHHPGR